MTSGDGRPDAPPPETSELDDLVADYKRIADSHGEHRLKDLVWLVNELIYEREHPAGVAAPPAQEEMKTLAVRLYAALCDFQTACDCWCDAADADAPTHSPACAHARDVEKAARPTLAHFRVDTVASPAIRRPAEEPELLAALKAITRTADDCPACDRGVLRHPENGHWPKCPFGRAEALIARLEP